MAWEKTSNLKGPQGEPCSAEELASKLDVNTGGNVHGPIMVDYKNNDTSGQPIAQIGGLMGPTDGWYICGGSTGNDQGFLEIQTVDNGNEPIYFGQYAITTDENGKKQKVQERRLTLLGANGETILPTSLSVPKAEFAEPLPVSSGGTGRSDLNISSLATGSDSDLMTRAGIKAYCTELVYSGNYIRDCDLDDVKDAGVYFVNSSTDVETVSNRPMEYADGFKLTVSHWKNNGSVYCMQEIEEYWTGKKYRRVNDNTGAWRKWFAYETPVAVEQNFSPSS